MVRVRWAARQIQKHTHTHKRVHLGWHVGSGDDPARPALRGDGPLHEGLARPPRRPTCPGARHAPHRRQRQRRARRDPGALTGITAPTASSAGTATSADAAPNALAPATAAATAAAAASRATRRGRGSEVGLMLVRPVPTRARGPRRAGLGRRRVPHRGARGLGRAARRGQRGTVHEAPRKPRPRRRHRAQEPVTAAAATAAARQSGRKGGGRRRRVKVKAGGRKEGPFPAASTTSAAGPAVLLPAAAAAAAAAAVIARQLAAPLDRRLVAARVRELPKAQCPGGSGHGHGLLYGSACGRAATRHCGLGGGGDREGPQATAAAGPLHHHAPEHLGQQATSTPHIMTRLVPGMRCPCWGLCWRRVHEDDRIAPQAMNCGLNSNKRAPVAI